MATPKRLALKSVRQTQATLDAVEAHAAKLDDMAAEVKALTDKMSILIAILTTEDKPPQPAPARTKK